MGFFEWWTDMQFEIRTNPWKAFNVGYIVGVVIGFFIFGLLALTTEDFNISERVGIFVGGTAGFALLVGGIVALNARFFTVRVSTYQRKAGLSETDALKQSLADSREQEIMGAIAVEKNNMPPSVAVICSVFGDYDYIKEPKGLHPHADFYLFTDLKESDLSQSRWKGIRDAWYKDNTERTVNYSVHSTSEPIRNMMRAKYYKTQWSHLELLQKYDYIIWVDGSFQVLDVDLLSFCQRVVADKPMAFFQHSQRNNILEEVKFCVDFCKRYEDLPMQQQLKNYTDQHFDITTTHLLELGCFVCQNRNTSVTRVFDQWWQEIQFYGYQDQISMPFVLWQSTLPFTIISKDVYHNEIARYQSHKPQEPSLKKDSF